MVLIVNVQINFVIWHFMLSSFLFSRQSEKLELNTKVNTNAIISAC